MAEEVRQVRAVHDIEDLYAHVVELQNRQARFEEKLTQLASQAWVDQVLSPIKDSITAISISMQTLSHDVEGLSRQNQKLNEMHEALLGERTKREREEHAARIAEMEARMLEMQKEHEMKLEEMRRISEEKEWWRVLRKWGGISTSIMALVALVGYFLTAAAKHIQAMLK